MKPRLPELPQVWREAVEELWRRRLRTLLTLLGLIFGVGAIVAMQAVGEGSRREALKLVEGLGLHNLIAEARPQDDATLRENRARSLGLTLSDAQAALQVVPGAERFAAEKRIRTYSVFSDHAGSDAQASGVSPDWFELSSLQLAKGRALTAGDDAALASVAVLGHQAAASLFPGRDQYDFWFDPKAHAGEDAILFEDTWRPLYDVASEFRSLTVLAELPVVVNGRQVDLHRILLGTDFTPHE